MIKLFKSVDDKLFDIGFIKIRDDKYGCEYTRQCDTFTQKVVITPKKAGTHSIQSYDPPLCDAQNLGNTCLGLTGYEMSLFLKKMKQIGLYN